MLVDVSSDLNLNIYENLAGWKHDFESVVQV